MHGPCFICGKTIRRYFIEMTYGPVEATTSTRVWGCLVALSVPPIELPSVTTSNFDGRNFGTRYS